MSGLMEVALTAARKAGEAIMQVYSSGEDIGVVSKPDNTPVTRADYASNKVICDELKATGIPVLSEESEHEQYGVRKDYERLWVVDPLDGTKEFIKRNGMFAVCIALVESHRPTLGVIYVPTERKVYFGEGGKSWRATLTAEGALSGVERLPLRRRPPHVVLTSLSYPSERVLRFCDRLRDVWPDMEARGYGSSIKQCVIAEGNASFYPRYGRTMEWDTAAGQVVIENAGGRLLRLSDCKPMVYNRRELANPHFVAMACGEEVAQAWEKMCMASREIGE